jgi:hypothetical protein
MGLAYKPEGLSPNLSSVVCPDIPDSFQLSWQYNPKSTSDYQTQATIRIYTAGGTTPLNTLTITGRDSSYELAVDTISWQKNIAYEWEVQTYDKSGVASAYSPRAKFYYVESPKVDDIVWSSGPAAYEYMGARDYFDAIRVNIMEVMADYVVDSAEEQDLYTKVQSVLFQGDIVPSRSDFLLLEQVIGFLYAKELVSGPDVDKMVEDGLGANDIHRVYELISGTSGLIYKAPQAPTNATIKVNTIAIPDMTSADFISSGKEDNTVQVVWDAEDIVDVGGTIVVDGFSKSEDIWYYRCEYKYGDVKSPFSSILYYRPFDFDNIDNTIAFQTRYPELFTAANMANIHHAIHIRAIDKRGNESSDYSSSKVMGVGFKTPLGLSSYEVQYEKLSLSVTTYTTTGTWNALYKSTGVSTTHTIAKNQEGMYFYRVRYNDLSGQQSPWIYTRGNKFDPLDPPKAPVLRAQNVKTDYFEFAWNAVPTAEHYEYMPMWWSNQGPYTTTATTLYYQNAPANTSYPMKVRAVNRVGASPWAQLTAKTLPKPIVTEEVHIATNKVDCWRTSYNFGHGYNPAGWYDWGKGKTDFLQGMWIELRDGINTDGYWVKKGTTYGNHTSIIYLDKAHWQSVLKGKEILRVQWWLERQSSAHGYPNDGRYIEVCTHNYTSQPKTQPAIANQHKIFNTNFGRGSAHYIDLPIYYGEYLRDGKIGGFGLHTDFRTTDYDQYTYCRFAKDNTYVKITYR